MSNWHILEQDLTNRKLNVVFHIPVPSENNGASPPVNLRTALAESVKPRNEDGTFGSFQSTLTDIDPAELLQLQNGELLEVLFPISFLAGTGSFAKMNTISNRYDSMLVNKIAGLRSTLKLYGEG